MPWAASAACRRGTKPSLSGRPYPAVSESPSATIWIGVSRLRVPAAQLRPRATRYKPPHRRFGATPAATHMSGQQMKRECRAGRKHERHCGATLRGDVIALRGVNLSLGRGAARVHILRDIDLNIGRGEAVGLLGPSGSGKSTLLMVMTGLERPDSGSVVVAGEELQRLDEDRLARFRGKTIRHRLSGLPSDPDHDGAGKRRGAARTRRRPRRASRAPSASLRRSGWRERVHHYPAELSGGEQQRVASPARSRPIPPSSSPTSRPAISTRRPGATSSSFCSAAIASAARRWFWSPTTPRSRRVATASCACAPGRSRAASAR